MPDQPKVWIIRAGRHGEDEQAALDMGLAIVGFSEFGDLNEYSSIDQLVGRYLAANPDSPRRRAENYARQLWALRDKIQVGDIAVLPLKTRPGQIALGRVMGKYSYHTVQGEKRHVRRVDWTNPEVPRSTFQQDLLHSFGAFITICRIQRNNAEERVQAVMAGGSDPGPPAGIAMDQDDESVPLESAAPLDIEQAASDEITAFIRERFPDHGMARLVEAVLQAEGLRTVRSTPGPDGGADILAGAGALGLDAPHLCVQVKASASPVDVRVFRELAGTMTAFKAAQGLLVSWGGFTQAVVREARLETFKIRLWDQSDLVQAVYRSYDKLPKEIQAELPLKRVWVLVREDEE